MAAISLSPEGFPMAPSQEVWDALNAEERARVVAELPNEVTDAEIALPEGDRHFQAKSRTLDALRGYYARQRRRIYLAAELPIYYPAEPRFAPDLLAVLDVEDRLRFFAGTAMLLESDELIVRLEQMLDQVQQRAEEEARRREEAEREVAQLREELERLKR